MADELVKLIERLRAAEVVKPAFDEATRFVPFVRIEAADRDVILAVLIAATAQVRE